MSLLKADTIKPVTSGGDLSLQGDSGGSAVDCLNITSAGDINFTGNTDAKIKLPSAGGIYESDGSTPVLTESGGTVSLGSGVVVPAGAILQVQTHSITTSVEASSGTSAAPVWVDVISRVITPASGTKIIVCCSFLVGVNGSSGYAMWRVLRDSTTINVNTGSSMVQWINEVTVLAGVGNFISTNIVDLHGADGSTVLTYKLQLARQATNNVFAGQSYSNSTSEHGAAAATHITLLEV